MQICTCVFFMSTVRCTLGLVLKRTLPTRISKSSKAKPWLALILSEYSKKNQSYTFYITIFLPNKNN